MRLGEIHAVSTGRHRNVREDVEIMTQFEVLGQHIFWHLLCISLSSIGSVEHPHNQYDNYDDGDIACGNIAVFLLKLLPNGLNLNDDDVVHKFK